MRKRTDRNQAEIIRALLQVGATVQDLSAVGGGCPDLLVGFRGENFLFEIKDHAKSKSRRKLTPRQVEWHNDWVGDAAVIESVEQALGYLKVVAM